MWVVLMAACSVLLTEQFPPSHPPTPASHTWEERNKGSAEMSEVGMTDGKPEVRGEWDSLGESGTGIRDSTWPPALLLLPTRILLSLKWSTCLMFGCTPLTCTENALPLSLLLHSSVGDRNHHPYFTDENTDPQKV